MSKRVLLVGGGGVGTIAAINLQLSGQAEVTMVLRSNYDVVLKSGYTIKSCDHGDLQAWRPAKVVKQPPAADARVPFDYIIVTTKNNPDIPPSAVEIVKPSVTPGHTIIVLLQNGLNIEKPFIAAFPSNVVLSGISLIGSLEPSSGYIVQDDRDRLLIGPFRNNRLSADDEIKAARDFVALYALGGKTDCTFDADVPLARWRKLVYNSCLNPICAITGLDTGRIRLAKGVVDGLVRPAMEEIRAAAVANGVHLPDDIADTMINIDPLELHMQPSMMVDAKKGNYLEFENLLGEPIREGEKLGVLMPTLRALYEICRAIQWRTSDERNSFASSAPRANSGSFGADML